jgi:hypothetical protein
VDDLVAGQEENLEGVLAAALRALEENARLAEAIARRSRITDKGRVSAMYEEKARLAEHNANAIRDLLYRTRPTDSD